MTPSITAIGFTLTQEKSELVETKLKRIAYADDLIVDLKMIFTHEKEFKVSTTVNFRWGAQAHVEETDFEFAAAVNKMMDILDNKIKKEKDKVQGK